VTPSRRAPRGTALTVYTPSAMAPALLESITVGRVRELAAIIDALKAAATSETRSHVLVIGPRGSGKSHLLTLAANRVRSEPDLAERLLVVQLPEEDYSILSYRDLLVAVLHDIGDHVDPSSEPDQLEEALLERLGDRVLVLVIENLNVVMERLGDEGQRGLRAFLHTHQRVVLIASTPALFAAVADHDKPMYGSFQPIHLTELSPEEGRELLLQVARSDGDDDLGAFIAGETGRARLQVVSDLAGGSPRLWLLLAGCMTVELLEKLVPLFVTLLDELTPYYKARLDELAPAQAKIVATLAKGPARSAVSGGAMTVAEIATAAGMTPQTVSKQLRELEGAGFVRARKLPGRDQRHTYYDLREPLLRHALDLKRAKDEPLDFIVTLLKAWHDPHVLRKAMVQMRAVTAEAYIARALAPPRPIASDSLYQSGSVDDLIVTARTALTMPSCRGAMAVEASVVALAVALHAKGDDLDSAIADATRAGHDPPEVAAALRTVLAHEAAEGPPELRAASMLSEVADRLDDPGTGVDVDVVASLHLLAAGLDIALGRFERARTRLERCAEDGVSVGVQLAIEGELAFLAGQEGSPLTALPLVRRVLDRRLAELGAEHPDTLVSRSNEAELIGRLGRPAEARDLMAVLVEDYTLLFGRDYTETLAARHGYAHHVSELEDHDEARRLFGELADDRTRVLGPEHLATLACRHAVAYETGMSGDHDTADELFSALIADCTRILGADHRDTLDARHGQAYELGETGDHHGAQELFAILVDDCTRALGPYHRDTLRARHGHAYETGETGDHRAARDLFATLADDRGRCLGRDHPAALASRHGHAYETGEVGDHGAARDLFTTLIEDRRRVIGPDHPDTLASRYGHAYETGETGDHMAARDLYASLAADCARALGADHQDTLRARLSHAYETGETGDHLTARDLYATLVADCTRALGPDHSDTLDARFSLADETVNVGDDAIARDLFGLLVVEYSRAVGPDHPDTFEARHQHAHQTGAAGDHAGACDLYASLVADSERALGPDHDETLRARHSLAYETSAAGDPATARSQLIRLVADRCRVLGPEHLDTLRSRESLAFAVSETGDLDDTGSLLAELAEDEARILGPEHVRTLRTRFLHGLHLVSGGDRAGIDLGLGSLVRDEDLGFTEDVRPLAALLAVVARQRLLLDRAQTEVAVRLAMASPPHLRTELVLPVLYVGDWDGLREATSVFFDREWSTVMTALMDVTDALQTGDEGAVSMISPELQQLVHDLAEQRRTATPPPPA
jgi:DNA-binding MarR family transcriptional regulator